MFFLRIALAGALALTLLEGCGDDCRSGGRSCGDDDDDDDVVDSGDDTGDDDDDSAECSSSSQCTSAHDCVTGECTPSGECRFVTDNGACDEGEFCSATNGCTTGCSANADCDDGRFCNGPEQCLGTTCCRSDDGCVVSAAQPPTCIDGSDCTTDECSDSEGMCVFRNTCDAGTTDGGGPGPFDPETGYPGRYLLGADSGLSTTCVSYPGGNFTISTVQFSTSGGTLTATGGGITMTGALPSVASFDVTGSNGCGQFRLMGTFSDEDEFTGTFRADLGSCSCTVTTANVTGARL